MFSNAVFSKFIDSPIFIDNQFDLSQQSNKIMLSNSDGRNWIEINDIIRCESDGNYTMFYIKNSKPILISKTLKEFVSRFSMFNFERVHQSHLINFNYVKSVTKGTALTIELDDKTVIPVSRRKKEQVVNVLKLKKPLLLHAHLLKYM